MAEHLLTVDHHWVQEEHQFVRWSSASQAVLRVAKQQLNTQLHSYLSGRCAHIKGNGGVKGAIRRAHALCSQYRFVARFDIYHYYEQINHAVMFTLLRQSGITVDLYRLVENYLQLPDTRHIGHGMVAGGSISPILAAVYLTPLDRLMCTLENQLGIRYQRYMDDFLIFAPTRHKLRKALRRMYDLLDWLKLSVHPDKRYIGTTSKGVNFLGYRLHAHRKLRPAVQSLNRMLQRARRLHEQGVDLNRLRQYVQRWYQWLHGGLQNRVSHYGRFLRIWIATIKHLQIPQVAAH